MSEKINTAPLSGMMELSPAMQLVFDHLRSLIEKSYQSFGFIGLDTPIIERTEVLLAKAGGETEKQIYRFEKGGHDLSLRFDLTVPLSRYVVEHEAELTFPFRRYCIGKVYRGERAQKGRYREFYQADIDTIGRGTLDLLYDAEIIAMMASTIGVLVAELNMGEFTIRINNRKLLRGFFQALDLMDAVEVLRVIDKIDKIGETGVRKELEILRLNGLEIRKIIKFAQIKGDLPSVLKELELLDLPENALFAQGLAELKELEEALVAMGVPQSRFCFDMSIARGLDYYTGTVFETILNDYPSLGSISSGGRYDNLTAAFSKQKMPGVGTSIGLTRFFSQLMEAGIISEENGLKIRAQVLVLPVESEKRNDGNQENWMKIRKGALQVAAALREAGIFVQTHLQPSDLKKQLKYADAINIGWTLLVGEEELEAGIFTLKDMTTGEQFRLPLEEVTIRLI